MSPRTRPTVAVASVRYFAVYPGGRRVSVTLESALLHGDRWAREEGVELLTVVTHEDAPVCGNLQVLNRRPPL